MKMSNDTPSSRLDKIFTGNQIIVGVFIVLALIHMIALDAASRYPLQTPAKPFTGKDVLAYQVKLQMDCAMAIRDGMRSCADQKALPQTPFFLPTDSKVFEHLNVDGKQACLNAVGQLMTDDEVNVKWRRGWTGYTIHFIPKYK